MQMFAAEQWRGFARIWLKKITVQCILEKSWLADAVEAEFAKAGLTRPEKDEPDGRRRRKQMRIQSDMSTQFLTEVEVAQRTHISLATLRRWRLENRGRYSASGVAALVQ